MLTAGTYAKALALKEVFHSLAKPGVLVDAGCGNGFHLLQIEAVSKIGLDIFPLELEENIEGIRSDVRFIPLKDGACDCLMSLDVIEHVEEDDKVMSEFRRVLSNKGILVLTTPNDSEFMPYRPLKAMLGLDTAKMHRKWGHVRPGYRKDELINLIERHGFEVISYHHNICQPLVRFLDAVYSLLLLFRVGEYVSSSEERAHRLRRRGKLIRSLERAHDLLFRLLLAPVIRRSERGGNNGFVHLVICKKG
jgi:SAM-dependent methyltransferase